MIVHSLHKSDKMWGSEKYLNIYSLFSYLLFEIEKAHRII
ncbi:hypothetical protein [Citrobacter freundii]|uniref:Uncharacterized protein n=1 Tax=Citrobacter freundii TaxID=546 RepID=A0A7G2IU95_CITFR|nr:hypothetical protein [Citrobacter freundii]